MAYNKAREEKKWRLWKEAEEKQLRKLGVTSLIVIVLRQVIITKNTTNQESIMQVILVAIVTVIATLLIFKRKVPELY